MTLSSYLRMWPLGLFVLFCLALAYNLFTIIDQLPWPRDLIQALAFGLSIGGLSVLAVLGGLCGRSLIRGIVVASLLAAATLVTNLLSDAFRQANLYAGSSTAAQMNQLIRQFVYAFNMPVFVFALAIPMILLRWKTKHYLSLDGAKPKPPVSLETLLLWTTISACLLYCCRVPMEILSIGLAELAVYLPGLTAISAAASAIVVVPSVRWPFRQHQRWWYWLITAAVVVLGVSVLGVLFNAVLSQWTGRAFRTINEIIVICVCATLLYLLGLMSLRASGFRWVAYARLDDDYQTELASRDRRNARLWTAAFVSIALLTNVALTQKRRVEDMVHQEILELSEGMSRRGERVLASEFGVHGAALKSLSEIPTEVLNSKQLMHLILKDGSIANEDLSLLKRWPDLTYLNLANSSIDDAGLEHLLGHKLRYLDLSHTKVTAPGIASLLKAIPTIQTLKLQGMQLTDEQLELIYRPTISGWDLANNRLTDAGVKQLWENNDVNALNLSANPISLATFDATSRVNQLTLTADESPLDDATAGKLATAGIVTSLVLGKTKITPQGLSELLSLGIGIELRAGSFTDKQLASIDPFCRQLSIVNCDITGDFLTHWTNQPDRLFLTGTKTTDQQILAWSKLNWRPIYLGFNNVELTDESISALRKIAPRQSCTITGTKITAAGLMKLDQPDLQLILTRTEFSAEELRDLKKIFRKLAVVSGNYFLFE